MKRSFLFQYRHAITYQDHLSKTRYTNVISMFKTNPSNQSIYLYENNFLQYYFTVSPQAAYVQNCIKNLCE